MFGATVAMTMAAAAVTCPAERAIYRLRGAPGVTAGFTKPRYRIRLVSDLFFWVRTPDGRRWWFSMESPNGYGGVFLTPDIDATKSTKEDPDPAPDKPEGGADPISIDVDAFDAGYGHLDQPTQAGDAAPAHLFARGLGPLLWYNPVGAANGDPAAKQTSIPIAMYDLAGCAKS